MNKPKTHLLLLTFALLLATIGQAAEPFRIYSPSSKNNTLWTVQATPKEDGLELKVAQKVKFEFSGRVITAHPSKPLLYVTAAGGKPGKVPGAVVLLNKDGSYLKHQNVNFNDGACYMSLDKENRHLLGVSYGLSARQETFLLLSVSYLLLGFIFFVGFRLAACQPSQAMPPARACAPCCGCSGKTGASCC